MIEGKMWCSRECPICRELIEAESKTKLKLIFQNHACEDNYSDNDILPGVREVTAIQTNRCYQSSDISDSDEVITPQSRLMSAPLRPVSSAKNIWASGPVYWPPFKRKEQVSQVQSSIQHVAGMAKTPVTVQAKNNDRKT